ncbi:MAG: sodium ion-translocating decarboxylase subunit beta, partial [Candidatus Cloacimonetes bacterium]|nr:sodium ion-translocating decarboxylase subunit beta [Candidatus Cloacimonadota bacterium]
MAELVNFFNTTGLAQIQLPYLIMMAVGGLFIYLGIAKDYEPLLLVPIGFGVILGNLPGTEAYGVYADGSVMNQLYEGVKFGLYPPLIFLGIGAMTDFSTLIANPKLILLGAAAQFGIFATFIGSILLGFNVMESGAIGIIGGADGPTSIFLSTKLAPHLLGPIAIAAYSYMALVPVIQPPIIKLFTTKKERVIRMKTPRLVTKREKIIFPIVGALVTILIAPGASSLLGMLFFGNLLKESGVTERLARTASNALIDIITILLGLCVGASTQAVRVVDGVNMGFLTSSSIKIFALGAFSFMIATATGV